MNDQEINIAIAEACGWTVRRVGSGLIGKPKSEQGPLDELPDWANDLNALHEAEKMLPDEVRMNYRFQLQRVVSRTYEENSWLISATARQRAEAFLRTIGKWKESPEA